MKNMSVSKLSINNLIKAQKVFERFRIDMKDDRDKAGATQAFEFCYELTWKTLQRLLETRGLALASPKSVFRAAAEEQIIEDPEIWFNFQNKRNLTVHTYNEENLEEIVDSFDDFSKELFKLIKTLEKIVE